MGHQHLQRIPRTRNWKRVVALIGGGANVEDVAAASSAAIERSMIDAGEDVIVRHAFFLLTQIPIAARSDDFGRALRHLGLNVGSEPSLIEIGTAMMDTIDLMTDRIGSRTDFGEIAQLAAVEAIQFVAGREIETLFGSDSNQVRNELGRLGSPKQFAILARDFFSRLMRRHVAFFLDRELSNHVGAGRRFASVRDHAEFETALDLHCREASRIVKEFAGEWFNKHLFEGGIDPGKAGRFVHVAAGKICEELRQRGPAYA